MLKGIKKFFRTIWDFVIEEYKFILFLAVFYIVCTWPINYYIIVGGGISDVSERVAVEDGYDSEGSFNLSYVSELKGTTLSYLLSYVIPTWEKESMDDYKYSESEDYYDILFRGDIDLKTTNNNAVKVAFDLAGKEYKEVSSKIYVIAVFDEYKTNFLIQDELLSIDGKAFATTEEYSQYVQQFEAGDILDVLVLRDGKKKTIKCKLYDDDGRKIFGVALQVAKEYETKPKVNISFKSSESGPSGGLMTTLEIYNRLVEDDITRGLSIAGTGSVDGDGNVGIIGGVRYKVIGAAAGGAKIFFVPEGENYKEAIKVKKEKKLDIKIVEVSTVKEAIEYLENLKADND